MQQMRAAAQGNVEQMNQETMRLLGEVPQPQPRQVAPPMQQPDLDRQWHAPQRPKPAPAPAPVNKVQLLDGKPARQGQLLDSRNVNQVIYETREIPRNENELLSEARIQIWQKIMQAVEPIPLRRKNNWEAAYIPGVVVNNRFDMLLEKKQPCALLGEDGNVKKIILG